MALPRSLAPLRHRQFAAVWTGAMCSNIGTWMETIGVGIFVTKITGQAIWPAIIASATFLPNGLISPIGGALADRFPRRTLVLAATTVQMVLAGTLTLLVATDAAEPWSVALIVLFGGCMTGIVLPAFQSLIPELVPREDLPGAVALASVQFNLGRVVGPALAGLAIGFGSFELAFAINTVSFLAVIVALLPLSLPPPSPVEGESIRASIANGLRFTRNEPGLRAALMYLALNALLAAPFIALIPAVAQQLFHNEVDGTSAMVTAQGLGAITMALTVATLVARFKRRTVFLGLLTAMPAALALYAATPTLELGIVAIFFVGACYMGCLSSVTTVAQLRAPREFRGRVLSTFMLVLGLLYPLGNVVQGAIADEIGLRATTLGAAALLAIAVLSIRVFWPRFDAELDDPLQPAQEPAIAAVG